MGLVNDLKHYLGNLLKSVEAWNYIYVELDWAHCYTISFTNEYPKVIHIYILAKIKWQVLSFVL